MNYHWQEEKLHILTKLNTLCSYSYSPGADLQPLINFYKKTVGLAIETLYVQKVDNGPMEDVTGLYDTSLT